MHNTYGIPPDFLQNCVDVIQSLSPVDNMEFQAGILLWKDWRNKQKELLDAILLNWHLRICIPDTNQQYLSSTNIEPYGDTVYFFELSNKSRWNMALSATDKLRCFANQKTKSYTPNLRIRCFIFETSNGYASSLNEEIDRTFNALGKQGIDDNEKKELLEKLQKISKELNSISTFAELKLIELENGPYTDRKEALTRIFRAIADMCMEYDEKINSEISKESGQVKTLIRTRGDFDE